MKKFILSSIIILSFGFYVIWQGSNNTSTSLGAPGIVSTNNTNPDIALGSNPIPTNKNTSVSNFVKNIFSGDDSSQSGDDGSSNNISQPISVVKSVPVSNPVVSSPKTKGLYNNGTYIGNSVFAYNDSIQVEAIISNNKLADIKFLKYPNRGRSGNISSFALPILKQEAISAQSANVNAVSGASYTSPAFVESLTSALNQAKA